jgi:hypothetical protein
VISSPIVRLVLATTLGVGLAFAQTPSLQDLQNKLLQFEESTQKTITELKAQIAALQQAQKAPGAVPIPPAAPQTGEIPVVRTPVGHYGDETLTREQAGQNQVGAPRIDNQPLDPKLRGFFHLPGTSTYMKFAGFVKNGPLL